MKNLPQRLTYIIAGLATATLIVLAFRPAPLRVDLKKVERGNLRVTVDAEGKTRIRSRFVVSAPVEGRLARIHLDEGDKVKQGQAIAHIDPLPLDSQVKEARAQLRELEAEIAGVETKRPKQSALLQAEARIRAAEAEYQEARARIERAKASLEQAKRDRQRYQKLHLDGAISSQDLESSELLEITRTRELEEAQRDAESTAAEAIAAREAFSLLKAQQRDPDYLLDVYNARIARVKAELANLADEAARTQIYSPVDGYVLRVMEESARYVEAGTALLELGNPSDLEIVVDLLSTDAVKVKPGATMLVEHWGGDRTLEAKVRYVEPSAFTKISALGVEEQRVNTIADFVDASVPLGDRYRVEVRIVVWESDNVLKVPLSAIFRCDRAAWCTFVVEGNKAKRREIEISQRNKFEAVVKEGLREGEVVILHPTEQIKQGTQVAPR